MCVRRAMTRFLAREGGNPGRAGYRLATSAQRMLDDLRARLAGFFDAEYPERMIFTLNCTDALNIAIKGVLREGDHAVTTALEHNSVSRPLQSLVDAGTITLTRVPMDDGGFVNPDDIRKAITPRTRLIVCTHCSNVLGTIQPAAEIGTIARDHDVLFLLDAAQSAGLIPISVRQMNIDMLAFPGHKALLGPSGTGGLYVGPRAEPRPWREGGTGVDSAMGTQPLELPYRLEAGTPNTVGLAGLAAGLDHVLQQDMEANLQQGRGLLLQLMESFAGDDRYCWPGTKDLGRRAPVALLVIDGAMPEEVATVLDTSFDIAVRAGLHCAPHLHRELGSFPDGGVRISPGATNTPDEMQQLVAALRQIVL